MDEFGESESKRKRHNEPHGGRKAEKKKAKNPHEQEMTAKQRNPKAFAFNSVQKAERQFRRTMDIRTKKEHIPQVDRSALEPPPFVVAIVGPPKVGKTTLLRCLIKNFCRQNLSNIQGPVTIVSGKKRRLTLIECNNDVNSMIDLAKICDLALLLVDASFGFEMETFEFLNICQVHGFPKIMGVLTHLDVFRNVKTLRRTKKQMKHRFWTEIYQGAKLFYLSGMVHDEYMKNEVHNLGRFISVMKFHPQIWRQNHSYIVADRMEELTNPDMVRKDPVCDRTICLYGFTRGAPLKSNTKVHIPGCGDFVMKEVSFLSDPCPLPDKEKKRSLNEKERLIYAPMCGVGGIVYDKDAVYIELGGSHSHNKPKDTGNYEKGLISTLIQSEKGLDSKMEASTFTLFSGAKPLTAEEIERNKMEDNENKLISNERRKVKFDDENESSDEVNDDNDDDDDMEEDEASGDENSEEDSGNDEETGHIKWKENLATKASQLYEQRQKTNINISVMVYGTMKSAWGEKEKEPEDSSGDSDNDMLGGLFKRANQMRSGGNSELTYSNLNGEESSRMPNSIRDWNVDEVRDLIKDCFVTGKWDPNNDAKALLDQDADDDEVYGDFEDMEKGTIQKGVKMDEFDEESDPEDGKDEKEEVSNDPSVKKTKAEKIQEKKRKLKAMFDSEYDEKDGKSYYDDLKAEMSEQSQLNKSEFESLDDEKRVQLEGFRAGMYVRVEIENIPCEFVKHFDPTYPIILGSLLHGEDTFGYVQVRLKKHRWYKRILKTRDPLIFSLGWRRFQTMPIYSIEDHNGRNRMLKYTPQHLYCLASFWGPITPQGAGILALQSISEKTYDFRIAATGVVLDLDKSTQIMKKLKLTGEPFKIYKKTAFIKGMFNTALEVTKFEGAALRTVSGLRGQIKKAIRAPPGSFRATFEDKILLSDIVFLRSWYAVSVPQFCTPVTSLLLPPEEKIKWQGMKTVGQLKREKGMRAIPNTDSLYTPIERKERFFKELKVPRSLQQQLPFVEKKKYGIVDKAENIQNQRIAVIQEPHEKEVSNMMKMIKTVHSAKVHKIKNVMVARSKAHKLQQKQMNEKRNDRQKMIKKRVFQALGKMKKKDKD